MAKYKIINSAIIPVALLCSLMTCPSYAVQNASLSDTRLHGGYAAAGFLNGQNQQFFAGMVSEMYPDSNFDSEINSPVYIAMLSQSADLMTSEMHNTLDVHLQQQRLQHTEAGKFSVFGGYSGGNTQEKYKTWKGENRTTHTSPSHNFSLGMGYQFTDNWQGGVLFSAHEQHVNSSGFSYSFDSTMSTAYSQLTFMDKGWINADFHYALLDYGDTVRKYRQMNENHYEEGKTSGYQSGVRVQGGWNFSLSEHFSTGPVVSYAMDKTQVKAFTERHKGDNSMHFDDDTRYSKIGSFGWRFESKNLPLNPWAQVMYSHQFDDVTTGHNNWGDAAAGVSVPLGKNVNVYAGMSTVSGQNYHHPAIWNAGINMTF